MKCTNIKPYYLCLACGKVTPLEKCVNCGSTDTERIKEGF